MEDGTLKKKSSQKKVPGEGNGSKSILIAGVAAKMRHLL